MAQVTKKGKCTGRCESMPGGIQPSPLSADYLVCHYCKQTTKKGTPFPGSKAERQQNATQP